MLASEAAPRAVSVLNPSGSSGGFARASALQTAQALSKRSLPVRNAGCSDRDFRVGKTCSYLQHECRSPCTAVCSADHTYQLADRQLQGKSLPAIPWLQADDCGEVELQIVDCNASNFLTCPHLCCKSISNTMACWHCKPVGCCVISESLAHSPKLYSRLMLSLCRSLS